MSENKMKPLETEFTDEKKEEVLKEAPKKQNVIVRAAKYAWNHKWQIGGSVLGLAGTAFGAYKYGYGKGRKSAMIPQLGYDNSEEAIGSDEGYTE